MQKSAALVMYGIFVGAFMSLAVTVELGKNVIAMIVLGLVYEGVKLWLDMEIKSKVESYADFDSFIREMWNSRVLLREVMHPQGSPDEPLLGSVR